MMRITEPWDPLGDHFVKDLVDDLFDEGHGSEETVMTDKRTKDELADHLERCRDAGFAIRPDYAEQIIARLRSMPEGEQVLRDHAAMNRLREMASPERQWFWEEGESLSLLPEWAMSEPWGEVSNADPATLIIQHGEDKK